MGQLARHRYGTEPLQDGRIGGDGEPAHPVNRNRLVVVDDDAAHGEAGGLCASQREQRVVERAKPGTRHDEQRQSQPFCQIGNGVAGCQRHQQSAHPLNDHHLMTGGKRVEDAAKPSAEFTQSSYFIASADEKVRELARRAVGTEKEPWKKALKIEKWVHDHMRSNAREGLAPADEVARNLEGDCTEYAMLTAAMSRAEGIPSKTALGLFYFEARVGPVFAFHMWTEVWIDGKWLPIDAILGRGRIGATHLKISDQSWHEERSLTPLLPVLRVLDKLSIEVVGVEGK